MALSWDWGEEEEGGMAGRGQSLWRGAGARLRSRARCWGQLMFRDLPSQAEQNPLLSWDALGQGARHKLQAGVWQSWEKLSPLQGGC